MLTIKNFIPLSKGDFALVDDQDIEIASKYQWFAARSSHMQYVRTTNNLALHRLVMGVTDSKLVVDHINGNGLDNRRCNLRVVTANVNVTNRQRSGRGYKCPGVMPTPIGRWRARVVVDGRIHNIGTFLDEMDAITAVNAFRASIGRPIVSKYATVLGQSYQDRPPTESV
jgi:hypothetical protein